MTLPSSALSWDRIPPKYPGRYWARSTVDGHVEEVDVRVADGMTLAIDPLSRPVLVYHFGAGYKTRDATRWDLWRPLVPPECPGGDGLPAPNYDWRQQHVEVFDDKVKLPRKSRTGLRATQAARRIMTRLARHDARIAGSAALSVEALPRIVDDTVGLMHRLFDKYGVGCREAVLQGLAEVNPTVSRLARHCVEDRAGQAPEA